MAKRWMIGLAVMTLAACNMGCYYDQWAQAKRANDELTEQYNIAKSDLQDAQLLVQQRDTEIKSKNAQLQAKEEQIVQAMAEADSLRDNFKKALDLLEKRGVDISTLIMTQKAVLPDALDAALKQLAAKYPEILEYLPDKGAVRWKADLLFELGSDKTQISAEVMASLREFAAIVNSAAATGFDVVVVGHTCTTPIMRPETLQQHRTNWHLSAHRAIAVMNIMADLQVSMRRMGVMGYGEHRPIADNATNAGKARNRRVEIYLVPAEKVRSFSKNIRTVDDLGLAFAPAIGR
ncbi:MAG: OmpA family protein [Planctomycetes bacterium]|nr:OmpA family protein [Planctomycetota bacterium]